MGVHDERGEATLVGMLLALGAVMLSVGVQAATWFVGQVQGDDAGSLGSIISGGAATAAVGGLVYIVKKILGGDLVARPTHDNEQRLLALGEKLTDLVETSHAREEAGHVREDKLWRMATQQHPFPGAPPMPPEPPGGL